MPRFDGRGGSTERPATADPREVLGRLLTAIEAGDDSAAMAAIRDGYEIFNTRGVQGWLPAFAEDIEWTQGSDAPEPEVFHGHDGVVHQQALVMDVWDSFRIEPVGWDSAEDALVVTVDVTARGQGSGVEIDARMAHLWRHRDGLVTRFEIFGDPDRALDALRSAE
jgi:uncharacterized protein